MNDTNRDRFRDETLEEMEHLCECGADSDGTIALENFCGACAIKKYEERLRVFVDPSQEGFEIKFDINVDKNVIYGFNASWARLGAEGYYDNIGICELDKMGAK